VTSRVLEILAQEVGLDESEMTDDLVFADCGVDSLLSLTATGRFREELGVDLESSVFIENPTILGLKRRLSEVTPSYSSDRSSSFSSMGTSTDISSAGSFGCLS
jgi:naphtho-gamma-pyrone polyketide synthase